MSWAQVATCAAFTAGACSVRPRPSSEALLAVRGFILPAPIRTSSFHQSWSPKTHRAVRAMRKLRPPTRLPI